MKHTDFTFERTESELSEDNQHRASAKKGDHAAAMKKGDLIFSTNSGQRFAIEYVSHDGNSFTLTSVDNDSLSRCYTKPEINRSFKKVIK